MKYRRDDLIQAINYFEIELQFVKTAEQRNRYLQKIKEYEEILNNMDKRGY